MGAELPLCFSTILGVPSVSDPEAEPLEFFHIQTYWKIFRHFTPLTDICTTPSRKVVWHQISSIFSLAI